MKYKAPLLALLLIACSCDPSTEDSNTATSGGDKVAASPVTPKPTPSLTPEELAFEKEMREAKQFDRAKIKVMYANVLNLKKAYEQAYQEQDADKHKQAYTQGTKVTEGISKINNIGFEQHAAYPCWQAVGAVNSGHRGLWAAAIQYPDMQPAGAKEEREEEVKKADELLAKCAEAAGVAPN